MFDARELPVERNVPRFSTKRELLQGQIRHLTISLGFWSIASRRGVGHSRRAQIIAMHAMKSLKEPFDVGNRQKKTSSSLLLTASVSVANIEML